jgi:hypothetical protein
MAFGTALHEICENHVKNEIENIDDKFDELFLRELHELSPTAMEKLRESKRMAPLVPKMREAGKLLAKNVLPELEKEYGEYEVLETEENLSVPMGIDDYEFYGFIDLVLRVGDRIKLIDWKTCTFWDARKRADSMTIYQLVLYKHYWCKKHDIDPGDVDIAFALLSRTSKKKPVEIFEVTSGKKRTENAVNKIESALKNVKKKRFFKNKLSCEYCDFKGKQCK